MNQNNNPYIICRHGAGGKCVWYDTRTGKRVDVEPPKPDMDEVFSIEELADLEQEFLDQDV